MIEVVDKRSSSGASRVIDYQRGQIVWAKDVFKAERKDRPWLVISNTNHPWAGEEYLAAPVTTQSRNQRVEIDSNNLKTGSMKEGSYVTPWTVTPLDSQSMDNVQAEVTDEFVDRVVDEIGEYLK